MKSILFILLSFLYFPAFSQLSTSYTVNTNESSMRWTGYYLFSFGEHTGTIAITKGQLTYTADQFTGRFEIDMHSILDTDMQANDGGNDLTNHLKSADFFSADEFPTAYFEITKTEKIKDAQPNQPNYDVTGTLTLKGVTNTLAFPIHISVQGNSLTASAKFKFDRTKWNVKYNSGKFFSEIGDGAISDAIGVELNVKAIK